MGVDLPPVPGSTLGENDKALAILCHLSVFIGVPFLLPLIVFLMKREAGGWVGEHAKEALNFHLTTILYAAVCCAVAVMLCFFPVWIPLFGAVGIFTTVCAIIAAVRASEGGFYRYPITLRLF